MRGCLLGTGTRFKRERTKVHNPGLHIEVLICVLELARREAALELTESREGPVMSGVRLLPGEGREL